MTHLLLAGRCKGADPPELGCFHPHWTNHMGPGASALLTCPAVTGASNPISISFNYQRTNTSALCFVCPPRGTCVVAAHLTGLLAARDPTEKSISVQTHKCVIQINKL